jgi:hypothetical protein
MARLAPFALAASTAAGIRSQAPEITIWPGQFRVRQRHPGGGADLTGRFLVQADDAAMPP